MQSERLETIGGASIADPVEAVADALIIALEAAERIDDAKLIAGIKIALFQVGCLIAQRSEQAEAVH